MSIPAPQPGSVIAGKYRVERVLGAGGMAVVLEATHLVLGQRVALKLLRADAVSSPGVVERFRQEAQIAAQLPGEHIVRVTDVGQTKEGEPYIVMELLVGRDLEAELFARGALSVDEAVDVMLQSFEGVAEAHAAGLIHRDLKPGNLFLTRRRDGSPHVKVLDFGISKLTRVETSLALTQTTKDTFGTPLYMSPEQIQSAKHVDHRSDQHALGAILYTLLAARPPFIAPSVTALSVVIATQPPPSVRDIRLDVPARLDAAIMRSLAKRPEDRFRDLAEFAQAIAPYGGVGADAAVRRITGTLAGAVPPQYEQSGAYRALSGPPPQEQGGSIRISSAPTIVGAGAPAPSDVGHAPPPYGAPPSYSGGPAAYGGATPPSYGGAPPGHVPPPPSSSGSSAYGAPPGYVPPPGYGSPILAHHVDFGGPHTSQTSGELSTAVSSNRTGSSRKASFALAIIAASALTAAILVALILARFGPRRGADTASPVESASPASAPLSASPVEPPAAALPAPSASLAPSTEPAPAAAAEPPPSAPAAAPAPASLAPKPKTSSAVAAPRPIASTKSTSTKKPVDPAKVFGAKR